MNFEEILKRNPNLTIRDLQELQRTYDNRFIAQRFSGFDKVRHTYAHIGKLMGRLAGYVHDVEEHPGEGVSAEDIKTKVIPDLLVYSAWLAEEFGVSMEQAYLRRFVGNLKRLYAERVSPEELQELEHCIDKRFRVKKD